VLRAVGLNGGLWYDEIVTLDQSVRAPLGQIVTTFPTNNQHTLFSILAHLSIAAFGEHPWSLRLPAMLLGVASIPALYLFARDFAGRAEALLASFLLAVAYHHVWFSQNARGYTAMLLLTILSSWLLLRGLQRGEFRYFIWYGIVSALGVYAHLTMGFLVASHALICMAPPGLLGIDVAPRARFRAVVGFAIAGGVSIALYVPLLSGMHSFFIEREHHQEVATPSWALVALVRGLHAGASAWSAAAVGAALVLAGLWSYLKQSPFVTALFVLPGLATVGGTIALGRPLLPRFLFFVAGFAVLILVRGAVEAGRLVDRLRGARAARLPIVAIALVAIMAAASAIALQTNYRYPKQDFDGALSFVEKEHPADEPIVVVGATAVIYRQHYRRDFPAVESVADLRRLRSRGHRIWLLYTLDESIDAEMSEVMRTIRSDCELVALFHGTVGHGDIWVCTAAPVAAAGDTEAEK
jgi:uncharacterized membrane protein